MAGARHFSELVAWQIADEVRVAVYRLTGRPPFALDFKLRRQIDDAASSVCRNIAEGFGCESHVEFARFLEISRRSLNEVQDCLRDAQLKGHVWPADVPPILATARRLHAAIAGLRRHLLSTPSPRRAKPPSH